MTTVVKTRNSWLTSVIVGTVAVVVLAPLLVATVESLLVPALVVLAVVLGLRFLWYWTSL